MSHNPERKEKDCLNCGAIVQGRYCQVCGQENIIPKESFRGLVTHFFYDITHFDGKFFKTLKILFLRPGFLSREHLKGRRASYLHPVRMYMFTSAIFFLVFFSVNKGESIIAWNFNKQLTRKDRETRIKKVQNQLNKDKDNQVLKEELALLNDTTQEVTELKLARLVDKDPRILRTGAQNFRSAKEYDSVQEKLSPSARDSWFLNKWRKKEIEINNKFSEDPSSAAEKFSDLIVHKLPYLLFISLPFFAAILKLLYIRRKNFYYADHAIFTIHHFIYSFLLFLVLIGVASLKYISGWGFFDIIIMLLWISWPVYLYIAMKKFFQQGWFKTLVKFLVLNMLWFVVILFLFIIFFFFSVFQL